MFVSAGANDPGCYAPTLVSKRRWMSFQEWNEQGYSWITTLEQPFGLCEFGHQGLPHEEELDNGNRIQNRHRVLHASLGRFIQRDPLGYVDGMSLYQYVRGNPVRYGDWWGLARVAVYDPKDTVRQDAIQQNVSKEEASTYVSSLEMASAAIENFDLAIPAISVQEAYQRLDAMQKAGYVGTIDELAILDHGSAGCQELGNKGLTPNSEFQNLAGLVDPNGQIILYGCEVASIDPHAPKIHNGDEYLQKLADSANRTVVGYTEKTIYKRSKYGSGRTTIHPKGKKVVKNPQSQSSSTPQPSSGDGNYPEFAPIKKVPARRDKRQ